MNRPLRRALLLTTYLSAAFFGSVACDRQQRTQTQSESLPRLGQVPAFSLTNQEGAVFGSDQLKGRAYVAAFMFTRCPSICPRLTAAMKRVDALMQKENKTLSLISISVDPEYDTPKQLSEYAKKHGADPSRWNFLTGDFKTIARTAEQGFKVALAGKIDQNQPHLGITHASHLILVDGGGEIRGYFRTSDEDVDKQILVAVDTLEEE